MLWLLGGIVATLVVVVVIAGVLLVVVRGGNDSNPGETSQDRGDSGVVERGGDDPNPGGTSPDPGDPRVVVSDVPGNTVRCTNVIEDGAVVTNDDFEACINGGEGPMVEYASCADGEDAATPQYDGQRYLIHVGSEPVEYSPPDPEC